MAQISLRSTGLETEEIDIAWLTPIWLFHHLPNNEDRREQSNRCTREEKLEISHLPGKKTV